MLVDSFEPVDILNGLSQSIDAIRFPLNARGLLDYWWKANDHSITVERKEIKDFIGSLNDGSLVDRLRMAIQNKTADEIALLVEGVYTPHGTGVQVWKQSNNGKFFFRYRTYAKCSHKRIQAALYSLDKAGCTIYHTDDVDGTITTLVALYDGSQDPECKMLDKYRKPKPVLQEYNPYVEQLMSIPGLGEEKAKELVLVCGTPYDVYSKELDELAQIAGVGKKLAGQILRAVGREL